MARSIRQQHLRRQRIWGAIVILALLPIAVLFGHVLALIGK
jgi:hypothetical protein